MDKTLRILGIIFLVLTALNILSYAVLGMNARLQQKPEPSPQTEPKI